MGDFFDSAVYEAGARLAVLTTQPIGPLDYLAPEGGVVRGAFVEVPLGPRKVLGVVWGPGDGGFDAAKLRRVIRVLEPPPLTPVMMEFIERSAAYTMTPLPAMLRLATRVPDLGKPPGQRRVFLRGDKEPARMTDARARVLDAIDAVGGAPLAASELAEAAGVSAGVVKGLAQQGALVEIETPKLTPYPALNPARPGKPLSDAQAEAAAVLREGINSGTYGTTLLQGVTGSGKTEVYLEAVAACLAQGRQALVLLPEIALSAEFLTRVEARFGARPAEWHHGVTRTERQRCWQMVGEGSAQLVVGARSALYLPFRDLGLIVVDEEHDTSYKQEDGVLYNARDMAVLRASLSGAQVVLASATPCLESWCNAQAGKYARVRLAARFGPAVLPQMRAIDMRTEELAPGTWIGPTLRGEVNARRDRGEQSLLFLNRRGFAPVTVCRACGHQIACDHCDARMVEHRFLKQLMCHQCGETKPIPTTCPNCQVEGKLAPVGPGVERLAEEAAAAFPEAKIVVLSSDLFTTARALKERIAQIAQGDTEIIIGTQLVAKGHNFPRLTLVGVIDADLGLQGSDLRAAERTFQLMRQVAGRAGRAEKPGLSLLQSFQPEHPVMAAIIAGDEEKFWQAEATEREAATMPPFGKLAGLILSGPEPAPLMDIGTRLARNDAPLRALGAMVFGPAPAPIARIRGQHRVRLLVKAPKGVRLQPALSRWLAPLRLPNGVRLAVDIDPQSFF